MTTDDGSATGNKIGLTEAITWTTVWRSEEATFNSHNECNGFLIPLKDLKDLVSEMDKLPSSSIKPYVRAYLGVKVDDKVSPPTKTEKLILVGTKPGGIVAGQQMYIDMISDERGNPVSGGGGSIWDFSLPCPPACDPNSPLN